jgi:hypothetical protein
VHRVITRMILLMITMTSLVVGRSALAAPLPTVPGPYAASLTFAVRELRPQPETRDEGLRELGTCIYNKLKAAKPEGLTLRPLNLGTGSARYETYGVTLTGELKPAAQVLAERRSAEARAPRKLAPLKPKAETPVPAPSPGARSIGAAHTKVVFDDRPVWQESDSLEELNLFVYTTVAKALFEQTTVGFQAVHYLPLAFSGRVTEQWPQGAHPSLHQPGLAAFLRVGRVPDQAHRDEACGKLAAPLVVLFQEDATLWGDVRGALNAMQKGEGR